MGTSWGNTRGGGYQSGGRSKALEPLLWFLQEGVGKPAQAS